MNIPENSPLQAKKNQKLLSHLPAARTILENELGEAIHDSQVHPITIGLTNFVYRARVSREREFIVRLNISSDQDYRSRMYQRSSFVTRKFLAHGLRVNRVLSTGTVPFAYSLEECLPGFSADRLTSPKARQGVFLEMGKFMKQVNTLTNVGFGQEFDYGYENSPALGTVSEFLQFSRTQLLSPLLQEEGIISLSEAHDLCNRFHALYSGNYSVGYVHGDLRLENVLTNDKGYLIGIVDWDLVRLDLTPLADLAQALSTSSLPEQELSYPQSEFERRALLAGYGVDYERLRGDVDTYRLGKALLTCASFLSRKEHYSDSLDSGWSYRISRHLLKSRELVKSYFSGG